MRRKTTLLFSLLTCVASMAQTGTISPANGSTLMPKPAFTINFDESVSALSDEDARINLCDAITITDGNGKTYEYAIGPVTATSINFVLQDLEVLPPNTSVTIKTPTSLGGQTFSFTTEDYYVLDASKTTFDFASSKKNTLYIAEGVKLLIDKTLKCKQLIVEPNAGITISSTGSLTVYDTAYFLPNVGEIEGMPFLINKGSYQAAGTVFMRDLPPYYYEMCEMSLPITEVSSNDFTISNCEYGIMYGNMNSTIEEDWRYDRDYWYTLYGGKITYDWAYTVQPWDDNLCFRMKGDINELSSYSLVGEAYKRTNSGNEYYVGSNDNQNDSITQTTKIPNVYQSPIDLRKMYEDGRLSARNLYMKNDLEHINSGYTYNLKSGFTTYDGPMSYGYLLNQISNAADYTSSKIIAKESKEDLSTPEATRIRYSNYDETTGKYVDKEPKYPYIRFYCNYSDGNAKSVGKRSVCVVYFVEDEEEQAEMRENINTHIGNESVGGNPKYDAVFFGEESVYPRPNKDDDPYSYSYPYIVARKTINKNNAALSIASYNYPEDSSDGVEVTLAVATIADDAADNVEVGILDYYLPGLIFENSEEISDLIFSRDTKKSSCSVEKDNSDSDKFHDFYWLNSTLINANHLERTFTLRFRLPANEEEEALAAQASYSDPSSITEIDESATESSITVSGSEIETIVSTITYSINVDTQEHGTITVDKAKAAKGDKVTITATPDANYYLKSLKVNNGAIDVDELNTFEMPGKDVTITAEFATITGLAVTVSSDGNGIVTASKYDASVGDEITIYYEPNDGYELDKIITEPEIDGLSYNSTQAIFTMPAEAVDVAVSFKAISYNVIVADASNGSISVDKSTAIVGEEVQITIEPDLGYRLAALYFSDGKTVADEYNTFVMPAHDVTVNVIFTTVDDYWINAKATPSEGGLISVSDNDAIEGATITISTQVAEGYELTDITATYGDNEKLTITDNAFTMPAANVTVEATYSLINYTVNIADMTNGMVEPNSTIANMGDEVVLTVVPSAGYHLSSLLVNSGDIVVSDDYKFTMPAANVTIEATFEPNTYNIVFDNNGADGTETMDNIEATYDVDIDLTENVFTNTGYTFANWNTEEEGNGQSYADKATVKNLTTEGDVTLYAIWEAIDYDVTVAETLNGTIAVSKPIANVGDEVTITVTPAEGYELDALATIPELELTSSNTFVMPASDVEVTATFKAIDYDVTVADASNGSISVDKLTATVGEEVTITITPAKDYALGVLTIDGEEVDSVYTYTFIMPAHDVEVEATFEYISKVVQIANIEVAQSLFDWIIVINNTKLHAAGYEVSKDSVTWYKVVGDKDEWITGKAVNDEVIGTGVYFTNNQSLIGQGEIYAVIAVGGNMYIVSNTIDYSGSKSLKLTPTAVNPGQTLRLAGLPNEDAIIKVYNIYGTVMSTMNTNGTESITFSAESTDGVYIVNVYVGEYMKSVKYVVK